MIKQGSVRQHVGWPSFAAAAVAASCFLATGAAASTTTIPGSSPVVDRSSAVDAMVFFDELIARYRRIDVYQDVTVVHETTTPPDGPAETSERRMSVEVRDDALSVNTADAEWRRRLGLDRAHSTKAMSRLQERYRRWLAPHASLRFTLEPLIEWRQPTSDVLTPTSAEPVMVDNRELVQISLRGGDAASADCPKYDLFVNPESMLIERIEGEEHLADGWARTTRLDITPIFVRDQANETTDDGEIVARETGATDDVAAEDTVEDLEVFSIDDEDANGPSIRRDERQQRQSDEVRDGSPPPARQADTPPGRSSPPPGAALGPLVVPPLR